MPLADGPCPKCPAKGPGPCLFQNGKPRTSFHAGRPIKRAPRAGSALARDCQDCPARVGQDCLFANGKPPKSPHPARKSGIPSKPVEKSTKSSAPVGALELQRRAYVRLGLPWGREAIQASVARHLKGRKLRGGGDE